tara:strand:- start:4297 stop:4431 length:135 start_codon:yes stop_codon:yes gene_type:complete
LLAGTAASLAVLQGEQGAPMWLNELRLPHVQIDQAVVMGDLERQ